MLLALNKPLKILIFYTLLHSIAFAEISFTQVSSSISGYATQKNGRVAYNALSPTRLFTWENGITTEVVISGTTVIPNSGGFTFDSNDFPSPPAINNSDAAVLMMSSQNGIYQLNGNAIKILVDTSTVIPQGGGIFTGFFRQTESINLDENNIAFRASDTRLSSRGIYAIIDGALSFIADRSTLIPNTLFTFNTFGNLDIEGKKVAFEAESSNSIGGIYTWDSDTATITSVADSTIPCPNTAGNITDASRPRIDDSSIVFYSQSDCGGNTKLWTNARGFLEIVAESNVTPDPNSNGTLLVVDQEFDIENNRVVFCANNTDVTDNQSIYMWENGIITRLFGVGDVIDGASIQGFGNRGDICQLVFSRDSLSGDFLVFRASLSTTGNGLYLANLNVSTSTPTETTVPLPLWSIIIMAIILVSIGYRKYSN